jgi:predicted amino acid racemase
MRSLPSNYKVEVKIWPGSHVQESEINKQINDKERVAAALENKSIVGLVNKNIKNSDRFE